MAMGKGYRILHKLPPDRETPYSVMMDSKAAEDTLMFESGAVVVLCKYEKEIAFKIVYIIITIHLLLVIVLCRLRKVLQISIIID